MPEYEASYAQRLSRFLSKKYPTRGEREIRKHRQIFEYLLKRVTRRKGELKGVEREAKRRRKNCLPVCLSREQVSAL